MRDLDTGCHADPTDRAVRAARALRETLTGLDDPALVSIVDRLLETLRRPAIETAPNAAGNVIPFRRGLLGAGTDRSTITA